MIDLEELQKTTKLLVNLELNYAQEANYGPTNEHQTIEVQPTTI